MQRILITGGADFLGSHLCDQLVARSDDVLCVDNFFTGNKHNVAHPNDWRVVSNFIVQALKGQDITTYGAGTQTRSICYVDDLVEALLRMMDTPADCGSRSKLIFQPRPSDDPKQRQPDIGLAKATVGWEPKVALEGGLKETATYVRKPLAT